MGSMPPLRVSRLVNDDRAVRLTQTFSPAQRPKHLRPSHLRFAPLRLAKDDSAVRLTAPFAVAITRCVPSSHDGGTGSIAVNRSAPLRPRTCSHTFQCVRGEGSVWVGRGRRGRWQAVCSEKFEAARARCPRTHRTQRLPKLIQPDTVDT